MITTLLFTDIEGSTRLWEEHPEGMRHVLARHDAVCREIVAAHQGAIVKMTGDGMLAAFNDPCSAVDAAIALQRAIASTEVIGKLKVRCGLHAGAIEQRDGDVFGTAVNRAQRMMSAAHGGQVLVSSIVADLVRTQRYDNAQFHDLGDVRLRDVPGVTRLFQVIHPDLQREFPALRSLARTPNNLPEQLTSFVAREKELEEVRGLLARTRLLTLHGPGGIGKTRLALQTASALLDTYSDGVWVAEFAGISDPRAVVHVVASAFGIKEDPGLPLVQSITEHLVDRRTLLILDNSEHLLPSCAALARQLLQALPLLTIIASSREPLHIAGELTYGVPPLATPGPRATEDLQTFCDCAAVRLFTDRAASARPSFAVDAENAESIAQVCRRLDGIPLALELAAARVRSLGVHQIASRLDDRFALLKSSDATVLPRQQTLRALIDWSYDLLDDAERAVLRRLAVFAAGWTLEAAEQVCAHGAVARTAVVDQLTRLVEKSLVVMDAKGERYHLLDSVQQYALERLREWNEEAHTRDAQLAHYLALAQQARPELVGPRQREWLDRLDLERANILAAHAWCDRAHNGAELDLQLVSATRRYWLSGGLLWTGHRIAAEALARRGAQPRSLARCRALFDIGQMESWMGRYDEAQRHLQESLEIAQELGDKRAIAVVLQPLSMACMCQGDFDRARQHLVTGRRLAEELGDSREIASVVTALAQIHRAEGDLDAAEPLYVDALTRARALEDPQIVGVSLVNLAMVAVMRGHTDRARPLLREALVTAERTALRIVGQSAIEACAGCAAAAGDAHTAARLFGAAEAQATETGLKRDAVDDAFLRPLLVRAEAAIGHEAFEASARDGRSFEYARAVREAKTWLERA